MNKVKRQYVEGLSKSGLYITHDNGGRPFAVKLIGKQVHIFECEYDKSGNYDYYIIGKIPVRHKDDLMIGIDSTQYKFHGNSVLVNIKKNKYIFIGHDIREITLEKDDKILKYFSPDGNNDVPYPYAVGEKYTYLILEGVCIDNRYLKYFTPKDKNFIPYTYLYGWEGTGARKDGIKKFKSKVIVPRRWTT